MSLCCCASVPAKHVLEYTSAPQVPDQAWDDGGSGWVSLCCASVTAKHVHLYVLLLVGGRYAAHCRHQGGGCGASVPAAKHVHLYVLLLVGGRNAAHGRH